MSIQRLQDHWGFTRSGVSISLPEEFGRGAAGGSGLSEVLRGVARLVQRGLEVPELPGLVALA